MAQNKSNKGKEFWVGYGYNYSFNNEPPVNGQQFVLYLSADAPANVVVSVNGTSWSQSVSIPANTVNATVTIPKSGADDARIFLEGLSTRAVHIVSDTPIVVYAHVYNSLVSGATMLMPVETYGYKYYSLNYAQNTSGNSTPTSTSLTTQNGPDWYSWFYVIASENNTRINITPSDTTRNGWLPGQTYTVNLNKGEIYNVMGKLVPNNNALWAASKDMTGSKVLSIPGNDGNCHPVAVFSGSSGIRLCKNDGGEFMQQQVFPTQAWGTRYLTHHTINNTNTNINDQFKNFYRIGVNDPATVVKRNGIVLTGLINNFYYEFVDSLGGDYIEADKPILVAQYTPGGNRCYQASQFAYGDPEMFYLSAIEQGKKDVQFYATRNSTIDYNYLNVIIPTNGLSSLLLDGNPFSPALIKPHPNNPAYSVAFARLVGPAAQHRLVSDSNFTATVYGLGYFESYGYNVGTNINNLNYYSSIKNVFSTPSSVDTFTCTNTPLRVYVKLGYSASFISWKCSQVPGMIPSADSNILNPVPVATEFINGRTYYIYSLQQDFSFAAPGTYYIPVSYTASSIETCSQTETAQVKVVVRSGPVADFTVSGSTCSGDSIHFNGTPGAAGFNLVQYAWNFADNTTASGINTVKKFTGALSQNVRFRIYADNGCAGDTTKQVNLLASPTSGFGFVSPVCSNTSLSFSDSSQVSSGSIASWLWNYGDGTTTSYSSSNGFPHSYSTPGNFTISVVTTASNGCKSDTSRKSITILARPSAGFSIDKTICAGDSILFSDNSTIASGSMTTWNWNFADGNSSIKSNALPFYHGYTLPGTYTVSLVVQSAGGCVSDTFKKVVTVNTKPTAGFTINGKPCADSLQMFSSSITFNASNPANYYWNYGDGQTSVSNTTSTSSHSYPANAGNIAVKHVVSFGPGCYSDTVTQIIPLIYSNPVAQFNIITDTFCAGKPIRFISSLTTPGLTWNWNFGNGTGSSLPPFTRIYAAPGSFTVSLVVQTPQGCNSVPVTQPLQVNPAPSVNAGPDKSVAQGSPVTLDATVINSGSYSVTWTPSIYLNNATVLNPVSTPAADVQYQITVTDNNSFCSASDVVNVRLIYDLYIPNAFTPNGDGKNDRWQIPGMALYPEAKVTIFNRWGQVVYSTKNYTSNPWDGSFNGKPQPNDSFVYLIDFSGTAKEPIRGSVTIIR